MTRDGDNKSSSEILAHIKLNQDGKWEAHYLEEHLREVAKLAKKFATKFGSEQCGFFAGL